MDRRSLLLLAGVPAFAADKQRVRRLAMRYEVRVRSATAFDLWVPVPRSDPYQRISALGIDSPQPYRIHSAAEENLILHLRAKPGPLTLTMHFDTERVERRGPGRKGPPEEDLAAYLRPDRLVPIDGQIRLWAQEAVSRAGARSDLDKARAVYNDVVSTVKYDKSGEGWGRGDIYYACQTRRGNCTDFHAIFIGYCRALGIPARFAIGLPLPPTRRQGTIEGYHCWAEFHTRETGWMPIDASEAAKDPSRREYFFGAHDEHRVEFSRGRDIVLTPLQAGEPLNFFIFPYAESGGEPVGGIATTVTFRNL